MARPVHPEFDKKKIVTENRRARFEYFIEEKYEAGICLTGTEVKSLRFGEGSIAESYAEVKGGEVWLVNSNVPDGVRVTAADGYRMVATGVSVDLPEKTLVGSGGVSGAVPAGTFSANSLHADLDTRTVSLNGNARLHMVPGKLRMP